MNWIEAIALELRRAVNSTRAGDYYHAGVSVGAARQWIMDELCGEERKRALALCDFVSQWAYNTQEDA